MSALKVESDILHLSDPTNGRSTVHVGVTHPTPLEESTFGKLYLVTEIDSTDRINQDVVAALQDELRSRYYNSSELSAEGAFEVALQAGNKKLHEFITNGITAWVDHFNAIVAVVKGDLIILSSVGRMHAFLFRGNRITDIADVPSRGEERRNPLKIFSSVLTGRAQVNDRFLISTSSLMDFFSQEKLKRMIVEDLPSGTLTRIEHALLETPTPVSFGAILFAFLPQQASATAAELSYSPTRPVIAPQRSMEDLVAKERATEQLLSPKVMPNVGALLGGSFRAIQNFIRTKIFQQPPRRRIAGTRGVQASSRFQAPVMMRERQMLRLLGRWISKLFLIVLALPRWIGSLVNRRRTVDARIKKIPAQTTGAATKAVSWVKTLTPIQTILGLGIIIAIFVFSQTIITSKNNPQTTLKGAALDTAIQDLNDTIERASAALTYDDTAGAQRLIGDAQSILTKLPNKTKSEKDRNADLQKKIDAVRLIARHVVSPSLGLISEDAAIAAINPTALSVSGSTLLVSGKTANQILKIASNGATTKIEVTMPSSQFSLPFDSQNVLFGNTNGNIQEFTVRTGDVKNLALKYPNTERTIASAAVFQSRLYLLDTQNNTILRSIGGTTFGTPTQWLKDSTANVRDAIDLAVDGEIYTIQKNGDLQRFAAGLKDNVSFVAADPALHEPTQLWTNEKSTLLYILEPIEGRIVVYAKSTRAPLKQYVHDDFKHAVDFSIDTTTNTVFVLTQTKLVKFNAN